MAGLKFIIEGDDTPLRKLMKKLSEDELANKKKLNQIADASVKQEVQKRAEVVKAIDRETEAIKRKNIEASKKPILSDSKAEVQAYTRGQTGTITSGNALNNVNAESARLANAATAASISQQKLTQAVSTTNKVAQQQAGIIQSLSIKLQSYKNIAEQAPNAKRLVEYNRKIQETEAEIGRLSNMGKKGFDDMGNKIKSSGNLVGKLFSGFRLVANILPGIGYAGLLAFALGPIISYIAKLDIFKGKISDAEANLKALNEINRTASNDAAEQAVRLRVMYKASTDVGNSMQYRIDAAKELKKQFPDAFANSRAIAIVNGKEKDSYDALTRSIIEQARARAAMAKMTELEGKKLEIATQKNKIDNANKNEIKRSDSQAKKQLEGASNQAFGLKKGTKAYNKNLEATRNAINAEANKRADEAKKLLTEQERALDSQIKFIESYAGGSKTIAKTLTTKTPKPDSRAAKNAIREENAYQAALRKRGNILDSITKVSDEFNRKEMEAENEGRQAISDRFTELKKQLIEYNKWAASYNSKNSKKVGLVDTTILEPIKSQAIDIYNADLEIQKQKEKDETLRQLYIQHEDFKREFGQDAADNRFKSEMKGYDSYVSYVQGQIEKLSGLEDVKSKRQLEYYQKELPQAEKESEDRRFNYQTQVLKRALDQSRTVISERARIEAEYQENVQAIQDDLTIQDKETRLKALEETYNYQLDGIKRLAFEASKTGKALSFDFFNATAEEIKKQVQNIKDLLKNESLTPEQRSELRDFQKRLETTIGGSLTDKLGKTSEILRDIAESIGDTDSGLVNILSNAVNLAGTYKNIKSEADNFKDAKKTGDVKGQVLAGLGIAGQAIGFAKGLIGINKQVKEANRIARESTAKFYEEAKRGEMEYQALLRQRELDDTKRGKTAYQGIISQLEAIKKQSPELQALYTKVFESIQDGQFKTGQGYKHGTWIRKAKTWDIMASLSGSDYDRLEKLYTQGQLVGKEKGDFESLRKLRDELKQAGIDTEDLQNKLKELFTGTSVEGLSDALAGLFENGKLSAQDFADTFEQIVSRSIINTFKYSQIEKAMAPLFDQLNQMTEGGKIPGAEDVKNFVDKATEVGSVLGEQWKAITDGFKKGGLDLFNTDTSKTSVGTIARQITEETGSELVGVARGSFDLLKEANNQRVQSLRLASDNLAALQATERNTAATVARLDAAIVELRTISNNTSSGTKRTKEDIFQ